jgi:hypothetical protein
MTFIPAFTVFLEGLSPLRAEGCLLLGAGLALGQGADMNHWDMDPQESCSTIFIIRMNRQELKSV